MTSLDVFALITVFALLAFIVFLGRFMPYIEAMRQKAPPQWRLKTDQSITDYWHKHYVERGFCSLCGNTGMIDTRGAYKVGRLNYCICPNGQVMRASDAEIEK